MNASPETNKNKVELAPVGEPVKEAVKVNQTTEWVAGIVRTIQSVSNLGEVAKVLEKAKSIHESGDTTAAAELVRGVFRRLSVLGNKYPADLGPQQINEMVTKGKYIELAEAVRIKARRTELKDKAKPIELKLKGYQPVVDKTSEMANNVRKIQPEERVKHIQEAEEKKLELNKSGALVAGELAKREMELFNEVMSQAQELLDQMDDEGAEKLKEQWKKQQEIIGRKREVMLPELKQSIEEIKTKLKDKYKDPVQLRKKIREAKSPEEFRQGVGKLTEKVREGSILKKFEGLIGVTEKIQEKMVQGLSFRESCQLLEPRDYATVRSFLNSQVKLDEIAAKDSPWYDEDYVVLAEILSESEGGRKITLQLLENIDINYGPRQRVFDSSTGQGGGREFSSNQRRRRSITAEQRESLMAMDGENPMFGFEDDVSGLSADGVEYLSGLYDSEWMRDFVKRSSLVDQERLLKTRSGRYREQMQNVDFENLFAEVPELAQYLDLDYYKSSGGMVKIRQDVLNNPELLQQAESVWMQQVLFEQRMIAYEGVFDRMGQSLRATRLNTLNEIMGISTSKKGLARFHAMVYSAIDKQQNSYVDEETIKAVTRLWADQGPDFRLDHLLRLYREKIYIIGEDGERKELPGGEIGVMDFVNKLKRLVEDPDERAAFGIPDGKKARYGTVLLRHTQTDLRDADRELIFRSTLKGMGIDLETLPESEQKFVIARYQTYLDFAVQYLNIHKELHQAVGNASFKDNAFELPQGLPEAWYKIDPILFLKFFMRYGVGGNFKEAYLFGDPGVRDHITMALKEYAAHFLAYDENDPQQKTEMGIPTVLGMFFEGDTSPEAKAGAKFIQETFDKALFHWGSERHDDEVTRHSKIGREGDKASALRRSDSEVIAKLREANPSYTILKKIKWEKFAKMANDPRLSAKLLDTDNSAAGLREKWSAFVEGYGEHYFNLEAAAAKRGGDHPLKYGMQKMFDYYKLYLDWQSTPLNGQKINALLQIVQDVNSGAMPGILDKMYWLLKYSSEKLGKRWLLGGSIKRMALDEKTGLPKWNTNFGMYGEGDNEWPSPASEDLVNDAMPGAAIQKGNILESRGMGSFEDNTAFLNLLKDLRASGKITDSEYKRMHKELAKGYVWEGKLGPLQNMWRIVTLESAFEYVADYYLGITGHQLREILTENTGKTAQGFWKHLNS